MDYLLKTLELPNLDDEIAKRRLKPTGNSSLSKDLNSQRKNENSTVKNKRQIFDSKTRTKRTVKIHVSSGNSLDYNKLLEQLSRLEIDLLYTVYRHDFDIFFYQL